MEKKDCGWSEKSWQKHVNTLLSINHGLFGTQYIPIPDKVHGDGGLEGFSTDGCGYQSYSDQDSVSTADRTRKQKKKISDDMEKLETYKSYWESILQGVKLRFWTLVVPKLEDKSVLQFAREEGERIRKLGLSFIAMDFQAMVKMDTDFPEAYERGVTSKVLFVLLSPPHVAPDDEEKLIANKRDLVAVMDEKLERILAGPDEVAETRKELLDWFIRGSNLLDQLRTSAPWLWESIKVCIDTMAQTLRTEGRFDTSAGRDRLLRARDKLKHELSVIAGASLRSSDLDTVVWSTITLWLFECPLRFPKVTK